MDHALLSLKSTLKKIVISLKSSQKSLSFLLLLGPNGSGKSSLLKQSPYEHVPLETAPEIEIYFNTYGIILEINEQWLSDRPGLLSQTLKELNQIHHRLKITGLIYTLNINTLCAISSETLIELCKYHAKKIQHLSLGLGKQTDVALLFTQLDGLAGFTDFFQHSHASELQRPFGFSLDWGIANEKVSHNFKTKFDHWIHSIEQEVIQKIHPVRSSTKRILIREFPLQLNQLRQALYTLLSYIPEKHARVKAIYFTSAEQGGTCVDHLTQKIQQNYPIALAHVHPQGTNYRPYFIQGTLSTFQQYTLYHQPVFSLNQRLQCFGLALLFGFSLAWIYHQYHTSKETLKQVAKEWGFYEMNHSNLNVNALSHLSQSQQLLSRYPHSILPSKAIQNLTWSIEKNKKTVLHKTVIPFITQLIEQHLTDKTIDPLARYDALKIYLMLNHATLRDPLFFENWFKKHIEAQPAELTQFLQILHEIADPAFPPIPIQNNLVNDTQNYLKALPKNYLYYLLAKQYFDPKIIQIKFEGFSVPTDAIPDYLTKDQFDKTLSKLSKITTLLKETEWVLNQTLPPHLLALLQESYCNEYIAWWKKFEQKIRILPLQNYQIANQVITKMKESQSIEKLIQFLQAQTQPDFNHPNHLFNQWVANQFTPLNLVSLSRVHELNQILTELQPFLMTFEIVQDKGRSAFVFSKARFENTQNTSPLSMLYQEAKQFPEPISTWISQLADETWYLIMKDTKQYINDQWNAQIFQTYDQMIAKYYPFENTANEIHIDNFTHFFAKQGTLQTFIKDYLEPYLNTEQASWSLKTVDNYQLPISQSMLEALIRANVITHMFFPNEADAPNIKFTLQKLTLDPVIQHFELKIGSKVLTDTQQTDHLMAFEWPSSGAQLLLSSLEGQKYTLSEQGPWAFFKMLQKLNISLDEEDPSQLHILFEINGNAGRYVLKTASALNPFTPDILSHFTLTASIMTD